MRSRRVLLTGLVAFAGFLVGAAGSSSAFRAVVVVIAVAGGTWMLRGVVEGMRAQPTEGRSGRRRFDTYWPARCSHCGARGSSTLRMVAGHDAYICELCLRRGVELLDSPDDITRFI